MNIQASSEKIAHRYKVSVDSIRLLYPVLDRLRPFVHNYEMFLKRLPSVVSSAMDESTAAWQFEVLDTQYREFEGSKQIGGGWESPPEYATIEIEYPSIVGFTGVLKIPLPRLCYHVVDPDCLPGKERQAVQVLLEILENHTAAMTFLKAVSYYVANADMLDSPWEPSDELRDWYNDQLKSGITVEKLKPLPPKFGPVNFQLSGMAAVFRVVGSFGVNADVDFDFDWSDFEGGGPDYDDY